MLIEMIQITFTNTTMSPGLEFFKVAGPMIGAGVGAGIAGWLALRSYRTNQWWDTKRKAYQELIEALNTCFVRCGSLARYWLNAHDLSDEREQKANQDHDENSRAMDQIIRQHLLCKYLVAHRMNQILETMLNEIRGVDYDSGPPCEYWDCISDIYKNTRDKVINEASYDLRLASRLGDLLRNMMSRASVWWHDIWPQIMWGCEGGKDWLRKNNCAKKSQASHRA